MDDLQPETRVGQDSPATTSAENHEAATTVLGTARLLANPRRVRRA